MTDKNQARVKLWGIGAFVYLQIPLIFFSLPIGVLIQWILWTLWCAILLFGVYIVWQGRQKRFGELIGENTQLQTDTQRTQLSLNHYQKIFHASPIPTSIVSSDLSRFIDINESALKLNGYTRDHALSSDSVIQETWNEFENREALITQLIETGRIGNVEVTVTDKSGKKHDLLAFVERLEINNNISYATYSVDVTELKQARQRLEQKRIELDTIVRVFPDLFVRIDADGMIFDYMSGDTPALGISPERFLGQTLYDILPAETATAFHHAIARTLSTHEMDYVEYPLTIGDTKFYYEMRLLPEESSSVLCIGRDITARKRTESEIQESEEKFRQLADNFNGVLLIRDLKTGSLLYASPSFSTFWGHPPHKALADSHMLLDSVHPEDRLIVQESFAKQKTAEPYTLEYRIYGKNKTLRWVQSRHILIENDEGEVYRVAVLIEDITERKSAENALRQSENLFRQVAENLNAVLYVGDIQEKRILYVNPYFETIFQRDSQVLIDNARGILPFVHPEDHERYISAVDNREAGLMEELEYRIIRDDNEVRWLRSRTFPVEHENGQIYRMVGFVEDITENKRAEEALRESQQIFEQIAENISEVLFVRDVSPDRLIYISPRCEDIWQLSNEQILKDDSVIKGFIHPDDFPQARQVMDQRLQGGAGEVEYRVCRPDKTERWIRSRAFPIRNEAGDIYRIAGIATDITQQIEQQETLLETERLRAELEKERELRELKERFISMVSHEFRTPLTVIQSSAEIIEKYHERITTEQRSNHLVKIKSQIEHMVQMLDDVLALGFGKSAKFKFNPEEMDLVAFCHTIVEEFALTDNRDQSIAFTHQGTLNHVTMDKRLLKHIISNLLTNARKYSDEGKTIYFDLRRDELHAVFEIRDDGIGIPETAHERLFEPFHRANNVGNKRGTGLGLAIVKNSVDVHGGTIEFTTQEGVGTTFTVRLPIRFYDLQF